ncbi:NUDIX domain-containing protein [Frankia sp. Cppng1_Ct_nod]|uniref:NUDIX domain-containing protein n=1 Tax=Frankia sp. Cppng1_Ct_nod TaxID=2897162 RepID=UPI0020242FC5|nr:NUDIX domain-containing protein [Frankia sp. Cppng1_Ct_nod]
MAHHRTDRLTLPVEVHLLLCSDDRILLARGDRSGSGPAQWRLPSGNLAGQSAVDAAVRITAEQISLVAVARDVWLEHVAHHRVNGEERLGLFFHVTRAQGTPVPGPRSGLHSLEWHFLGTLPDRLIPSDQDVVSRWAKGEFFSQGGWE